MLRLVIFDLDGTVVKHKIDFEKLKREIGCPQEKPVLEYIEALPPAAREKAKALLEQREDEAAREADMKPGIREALRYLASRGIRTAIFTRNSSKSLRTVLERCALTFDACVSREDAPPKPSPEPVLLICTKLGIRPEETIVIGDFHFDITSGKAAHARTIYLTNGKAPPPEIASDYYVKDGRNLLRLFEQIVSGKA